MSIDLRKYAHHLEILYTDRMDITSTEESVDADNATLNTYPEEPQQKDIPCRLSFSSKDKPESEEPNEAVSFEARIFCSPSVAVKAGDRITVRRCHSDGTVYETFTGLLAETGRPNKFVTHQEFELQVGGDA